MRKIESLIIRTMEGMIVVCLAIMLIMVFGNVVLRYGFNSGIAESEELSRMLFVWMTFLGAVVAMRDRSHLGIDSFVRKLPAKGRKVVLVVVDAVMLYICWLMLVGSWQQTVINLGTRAPVTGIPMAFLYATGLVAGTGIGIYLVIGIFRVITGRIDERELVMVVDNADHDTAEAIIASADAPAPGERR